MRILRVILASAVVLGSAAGAFAQGCAMCYTQASAAGAQAQRSLDWGIFILMLPSLLLFGGAFVMLMRHAKHME
jgi:hypothetical protein